MLQQYTPSPQREYIALAECLRVLYFQESRTSGCLIEKIGPVLHVYFIWFDVIEVIVIPSKNLKMMGGLRDPNNGDPHHHLSPRSHYTSS